MKTRDLALSFLLLSLGCASGNVHSATPGSGAGGPPALAMARAPAAAAAAAAPTMTAHFIDVGQGAATFFEFPCGCILIDTGAQDAEHVDQLVDYLKSVFGRRPDLHDTIDTLFITHPHKDHTLGIKEVCRTFTVKNYVDDGITHGSGGAQVTWMRQHGSEGGRDTDIREVLDDEVTQLPKRTGLTDRDIDCIKCATCDPQIHVLSGQMSTDPGWGHGAFDNANNQSLVIRVDFGKASFLVTGDLEEPAIETLVDYYAGTKTLDCDVWEVGHHGSYNGTTESILKAITPEIAVIECGRWDFGKDGGKFTTWAYGHPRKGCIDLLEANVSDTRDSKTVKIATAAKKFEDHAESKAIYATGWDGTVRIEATLDGKLTVLPGTP